MRFKRKRRYATESARRREENDIASNILHPLNPLNPIYHTTDPTPPEPDCAPQTSTESYDSGYSDSGSDTGGYDSGDSGGGGCD